MVQLLLLAWKDPVFHRTYLWRDKNNFLVQFLAKEEFVLICLKKTNKHKLSNGFWLEFLLEIQSSYTEFFLMLLWKPALSGRLLFWAAEGEQLGIAGALERSEKVPRENVFVFLSVWCGDSSFQLRVDIENCCDAWLELHHKRATRGHKSSAPAWEKMWEHRERVRCGKRSPPSPGAGQGQLWQQVLWVSMLLCWLQVAFSMGSHLVIFAKCCC